MAWLAGCRRLHRRYERKADHFLAFTSIACTLICCRKLCGAGARENGVQPGGGRRCHGTRACGRWLIIGPAAGMCPSGP
jgi:hypothetical protein